MKLSKKVLSALILLIIFSLITGCSGKEVVEETVKVPVEVYEARIDTIVREITIAGLVEPEISAMVIPEIAGGRKVISIPVKVGDSVRKGTVLAYLDSESTALNYEIAEASFLDAEKNYERNKALFDAGAISKSQFEQIEIGFLQAKNAYELRRIELSSYSVKSPVDGVVSSINVTEGNFASAQSPVAVISKIDKVLLKSSINEKEVKNLSQGQEVSIIIPNMGDKEFTGKIKSVAPTMDMQIRSFPLEIEIDNSNHEIQPGIFAKASVVVENRENVVVVPSQAVIIRGNQGKVFIIEDERAQSVNVEPGLTNNYYTEIITGIKPGDKVITRGNDNVIIGDLVRIVEPMEQQVQAAREEASK